MDVILANSPAMHPPPLRPAPERFAEILYLLSWAVAKQAGWGLSLQLIALIGSRITRIKQRFAALAARLAAGTYRPRPPAAAPRRPPANPAKPPPPNPLPNRPGWLLPLEKSAVAHREHLERLFADPEMVALLAQAPEAMARVLRPLCRMLRLDLPPVLAAIKPARRPQRPPRPGKPRAPAPAVAPPPWPPRPVPLPPPPALTLEYDYWGEPHLVWS
jgi:hypothetical protein